MPVLNIDGRKVRVGDEFLKMSPEDQNATVDEIVKKIGPAAQPEQPAPPAMAAPAPQSQDRGIMGTVDDYVRAAANGMTFGLADRFAAKMGSATGIGGTSGDYAGNLRNEQQQTERFEKENPIASIGANVAGGIMVPLGAIGAASRGATLGTKTAYGMGAGGVLGGAQGFGTSKDWTDIPQTLKDTGVGLVGGLAIGGAIPGTAKIIGHGFNAATNAYRGVADGMSRGASRHLVEAMAADTPAAVQSRLAQLGPDAMLADAGPAYLGKTQGASLSSDEGRSILFSSLSERNRGTNQRIMDDVNRAVGPAEDPQTVSNAIRARRSEVDAVNYPAAFENAPAVDTSRVLEQFGPMLGNSVGLENRALTNLRQMMMTHSANGQLVPQSNAQILHKIKGELDNVIEYDAPGLGLPAAALSRQQGALKHLRGALNETLEQQVPGYMAANRQSAALARRGEAVELGTQYLGNGKTTAHPARFADEFSRLEPGEQIAFAKGSRGEIERKLGTKANDLVALKQELQGDGGFNTAKLATVHGQQAADELVGSVDRNLAFRSTHDKVAENSQTEIRRSAREAMKPTPASEAGFITPSSTLTGMSITAAKKGVAGIYNALVKGDPTRSYGEVADVLTRTGEARDRSVQAIIDALDKRTVNKLNSGKAGDRASLLAAIAASGAAANDRKRRQGSR